MLHISYQLYCSRNFPPLADTCKMLSAAGYTEVEGYGGLFADRDGLKRSLNTAGLKMSSAHMSIEQVEGDADAMVALAKELGTTKVFVPYLMPDARPKDDAGWRDFGQRLARAGAPFRAAGIVFGWHNHDFEFVPLASGALPIDLIAEADIALELDLGWVVRAGHDPLAWISKYQDKIAAVHVKDLAPAGTTAEDGWADVGHGTQDWPAIHRSLKEAGINHYVVEHDNPADDARFARRSHATLAAL